MSTSVFKRLRTSCLLLLGAALVVFFVGGLTANANPAIRDAWETFYDPIPIPGNANCQLCHGDTSAPEWNGYGWDIFDATVDLACDGADGSPMDSAVSLDEAFACVETDDSDFPGDPTGSDNITEINAGAQPGWTTGPNNTIFTQAATIPNQDPVEGLEPYDPDGAGGMGGAGGAGGMGGAGGDCQRDPIPPEQIEDGMITVRQGQSIQAAIDQAEEGTRIEIEPGIMPYEEPCNLTNGLEITKNGIQLIGLSTAAAGPTSPDEERVIVRSTGDPQRNGIVIMPLEVPQEAQPKGAEVEVERTDCMACHTDMAPPFPLHPNVPKIIPKQDDPWLSDIVIQGITIEGFSNNGLFTEHVERFTFEDVESIDNRNYGIFPVLSRDGLIQNSYSTGSDLDSALWVETSERVNVFDNLVENSVNGIEVSNSDDVLVMGNVSQNNTVGAAILLLPDIFNNRGSAKRIDLVDNEFYNNNKENTARPTSVLGFIPSGIGILYVGVDESLVSGNTVENHDFVGIGVVDYCLPFDGTEFACPEEPNDDFPSGFLLDQTAEDNRIVGNTALNNATNIEPDNPFALFAGDLAFLAPEPRGNCFADNVFTTFFSLDAGELPPCPETGTGGAGGMGGAGGAGAAAGSGGTGGTDAGDGGSGCAVGSAAPSEPSTAWLALLGCVLALSLRRRLRRRS